MCVACQWGAIPNHGPGRIISTLGQDWEGFPVEPERITDGAAIAQAMAERWLVTGPLIVVLVATWIFWRRRVREYRRREPWSLEKATWAQTGHYPTSRLLRRWRPNRRGGIR